MTTEYERREERRKVERKAIRRAARRAGTGDDAGAIDNAVRWARHRAPESSKSKLARGIIGRLRREQGR